MESPIEVKDIILCIENLNQCSRSSSPESDTRTKVWLKANNMKKEKNILRKENSRCEWIQLLIVIIGMLMVAFTIVALRIYVKGLPINSKTVPPDYPEYQHVVDWNVDFPEAAAAERRRTTAPRSRPPAPTRSRPRAARA